MDLTCIVCPNGCRLSIQTVDGKAVIKGALCKKGEAFAKTELENPTRSLTTTAATVFEDFPRLPVKTLGEIPKDKMFAAMKIIRSAKVTQRLKIGDTVIADIFGTAVVSTANMEVNL